MKICIITVYNSENCGSFLQAYALKTKLESLGHTVTFLKRDVKGTSHSASKHLTESLKRFLKARFWEMRGEWIRYNNFNKAVREFKITDEASAKNGIDCFIIGSDTIWNFSNSYFYDKRRTYLGIDFTENKVISYAASVANTEYSVLSEDDVIKKGLNSLDSISVRDEYTKTIVDRLTGRNVPIVVDPTLLLDVSDYRKIQAEDSCKDYILIYCFGKMSKVRKNKILEIKKKTGKKIVSFGEYYSWADKNIVYDPFRFLYFFDNAYAVLTNTFHGTIFSIIYHKKFVEFGVNKKKIVNLLDELGLSAQLCDSDDNIEKILNQEIDYNEIEKKLADMKLKSMEYLLGSLGE